MVAILFIQHPVPCLCQGCLLNMPSNTELSMEFELLETGLDIETEIWNERLIDAINREVSKAVAREVERIVIWTRCLTSSGEGKKKSCNKNTQLRDENTSKNGTNDIRLTNNNQVEQYSRWNNIDIRGIPIIRDKDCLMILQNTGAKIFWPLVTSDIDPVDGGQLKTDPKSNLAARFVSRTRKLEFQK